MPIIVPVTQLTVRRRRRKFWPDNYTLWKNTQNTWEAQLGVPIDVFTAPDYTSFVRESLAGRHDLLIGMGLAGPLQGGPALVVRFQGLSA